MITNYDFSTKSALKKLEEINCLLSERVVNIGGLYLLIDLTVNRRDEESPFIERVGGVNSLRVQFPHPDLDGVAELLLIKINQDSIEDLALLKLSIQHSLDEIVPESLKAGNGRKVCAWINSSLTIEDLSREISHSSIQQISCGSSAIFRFYDPAIFGNIDNFLDSWQTRRLFKNFITWSYINGDGDFCTKSGGGDGLPKLDFSLGMTSAEWEKMHYIALVNKILLNYRANKLFSRVSEKQAWQWLFPALNFYVETFSLNENIVSFGVDVLMFSPRVIEGRNDGDILQEFSEKKELHTYFRSKVFSTH